jgi:predicted peptidase
MYDGRNIFDRKESKMNSSFYIVLFIIFVSISVLGCKTALVSKAIPRLTPLKQEFHLKDFTLPYNIIYPKEKINKKLPLFVFLHGSGERGNDNESQLTHGKNWLIKNVEAYPMITLIPQCRSNDSWVNMESIDENGSRKFIFHTDKSMTKPLEAVKALINDFVKKGLVDDKRIIISGLSLGGMGTIELMWRYPGFFAAALPICGGGNEKMTQEMAQTKGIWFFHGSEDDIVDVKYSRSLVEGLKLAGSNVQYTEYAGVKHNSWDNVFHEKEMINWIKNQKKIAK